MLETKFQSNRPGSERVITRNALHALNSHFQAKCIAIERTFL